MQQPILWRPEPQNRQEAGHEPGIRGVLLCTVATVLTLAVFLYWNQQDGSAGETQDVLRLGLALVALSLPYVAVLILVATRRARAYGLGLAVGMGAGVFLLMGLFVMVALAGAAMGGSAGPEVLVPFVLSGGGSWLMRGILFLGAVQAMLVVGGLRAFSALPPGKRKVMLFALGISTSLLYVLVFLALGD
jgi:hypothetical protein